MQVNIDSNIVRVTSQETWSFTTTHWTRDPAFRRRGRGAVRRCRSSSAVRCICSGTFAEEVPGVGGWRRSNVGRRCGRIAQLRDPHRSCDRPAGWFVSWFRCPFGPTELKVGTLPWWVSGASRSAVVPPMGRHREDQAFRPGRRQVGERAVARTSIRARWLGGQCAPIKARVHGLPWPASPADGDHLFGAHAGFLPPPSQRCRRRWGSPVWSWRKKEFGDLLGRPNSW